MNNTFDKATSFNSDLSGWDISKVTDMWGTFGGATSFNSDLSGWDVSKVTDMNFTFDGTTSFNQTLSDAWATSTADKLCMFAQGAADDDDSELTAELEAMDSIPSSTPFPVPKFS